MRVQPPLVEVWHWSWLDLHWTTPLAWWLAWDSGRDPGRRQRLAPARRGRAARDADHLGRVRRGRPAAVLDGLRAGPGGDLRPAGRPGAAALGRGTDRRRRGRHHPGRPGRAAGTGAPGTGELRGRGRPPPAARRHRRHPGAHPLKEGPRGPGCCPRCGAGAGSSGPAARAARLTGPVRPGGRAGRPGNRARSPAASRRALPGRRRRRTCRSRTSTSSGKRAGWAACPRRPARSP